jgi:hypothetical protein
LTLNPFGLLVFLDLLSLLLGLNWIFVKQKKYTLKELVTNFTKVLELFPKFDEEWTNTIEATKYGHIQIMYISP